MGKSEDENKERGNWDSKADYVLSCVAHANGLGVVWRFPYLAYINGGGAFVIAYLVMLFFAGMPIFFMECALGQFASLSTVAVWKLSPLFRGIGISMIIIPFLVGVYYNVVVAYTVFYLFASLTSDLPWSSCDNFWNDANCSTSFFQECDVSFGNTTLAAYDQATVDYSLGSYDLLDGVYHKIPLEVANNLSAKLNISLEDLGCADDEIRRVRTTSPSEEYWEKYALNRSPTMEPGDNGAPQMQIVLSLLVAWIVVYYTLINGIKSHGKVVYFTTLFPIVILLILLIRSAMLEGAYDGIKFYIGTESDLSKLKDASVWKDAAAQIFFSLSTSMGGLIALSSSNKFKNNCFLDSMLVCIANSATSIFAGFAVFTIVGHMAFKLGTPVNEVVESGFTLAFVAYPEAITQLPLSPLWAILFFLMLFNLGLGTEFSLVETVSTAFIDTYPSLKQQRWKVNLAISAIMFLLGLNCCTKTGIYWLNLVDHYCTGWIILIVAVIEMMAIMWVYGGNRFVEDVEMMIGKKHWMFWAWWRLCWFFVTPLLLTIVLVWSLITQKPPTYGDYEYPDWANSLGWCMIAFGIMVIPLFAIYELVKSKGNPIKASTATKEWGPYLDQFRKGIYENLERKNSELSLSTVSQKVSDSITSSDSASETISSGDSYL